MRTQGETAFYCIHCGFDMKHDGDSADVFCPARDGDVCEGKRRRRGKPSFKRGREGLNEAPALKAPKWVKAALRNDEEAAYDPLADKWFGIRDGDHTDWRNLRELTRTVKR